MTTEDLLSNKLDRLIAALERIAPPEARTPALDAVNGSCARRLFPAIAAEPFVSMARSHRHRARRRQVNRSRPTGRDAKPAPQQVTRQGA